MIQRADLVVSGVVQGVGFRPFCARVAKGLDLDGTVRNTSKGVEIVLEGERSAIDAFVDELWNHPPQAAVVADVSERRSVVAAKSFSGFSIEKSVASKEQRVLIPADLAVCESCLSEMREPGDRRFRYPFINCTLCGPRYTIIRELPYDRPKTTMDVFPMCPECGNEYHNPDDRRYHAQPNACPACGPQVRLIDPSGRLLGEGEQALRQLFSAIASGKLTAIKGIGGFHIACLPIDPAVAELRERKRRPDKPFALMVRDLDSARRLVEIPPEAERLLESVARPIVLCKSKNDAAISPLVAPGQRKLGLMLPYAPLHHLLTQEFETLVMTSANLSDAPIVSDGRAACADLAAIVDLILDHDREIHTPIDDSVLLPTKERPIFLRRARGYVPNPIALPFETPYLLAAGAQLKSTYTLAGGGRLFPGQYLGDLDQLGTAEYYRRSLEHFSRLYEIRPQVLAHDLHPRYAATELARSFCRPDVELCPVQHHHAHFASVLLDNRHDAPAIGVIFDGTGWGEDGTIWGGEFLVGDIRSSRRMGSLLPSRLPGGERSIREPWRYALALLSEIFGADEARKRAIELWPSRDQMIDPVLSILPSSLATTSCGRLFDAASALLRICPTVSYDGQAAAMLENRADETENRLLDFGVLDDGGFVHLDWRDAVKELLVSGYPPEKAAAAFHRGLAVALADVCLLLRERTGIDQVALSGGVWQNALLLELSCTELRRRNLIPLLHRNISPNDEGVSVGQAATAAYRKYSS